uniref:uncharacterized protein LOC120329322 n=1 Tax=Styela clava TaxID=7725 RepID=UPI00193A25AD|nr:uncharacterized protein LOC120329322 [Styela clava]
MAMLMSNFGPIYVACWDPNSPEAIRFGCNLTKDSEVKLNMNSFEPQLMVNVECDGGIEFQTFMCLNFCYDPVQQASPVSKTDTVFENVDLSEEKTFDLPNGTQRRVNVTYGCRCVLVDRPRKRDN